jgi:hypothetical protein
MKKNNFEYCPLCHDYHQQILRTRTREIIVNGEDVLATERYLYCPKRNKNYMSADMAHSNFERASKEYHKQLIHSKCVNKA